MKKIFSIFFILILIAPYCVSADTCNKEETTLFNKLANNINIKYEHTSNNEFSIKILNIPNEIIVYDIYGNTYSSTGNNIFNPGIFKANESYKFFYIPSDSWNCELELEFSKTIYIRKYNTYSEREECNGIDYSEFKYCSPNYQGTITEEKFINELNNYNNSKLNEQIVPNENDSKSIFKDKYFIFCISGGILIVIAILIIFKILKNKRRTI